MTAARLNTILDALPNRILRKIERLSRDSGECVEAIIETGLKLYEKRAKREMMPANARLVDLVKDPKKLAIFQEVNDILREYSHQKLTPAQKSARGAAGGKGRADKLSDARRKEIAKKAAAARWGKKS